MSEVLEVAQSEPEMSTTPPENVLAKGSQGPEVRDLQWRLTVVGEYQGETDGNFNEETENAVKSFQSKNALPITGVADAATRVAVRKAMESKRVLIHPSIAERVKRTIDKAEEAVVTPVQGSPIAKGIEWVKAHPGLVFTGVALSVALFFLYNRPDRVAFGEIEDDGPLDEDEGLAMVVDAPVKRQRRKAKRATRKAKRVARRRGKR